MTGADHFIRPDLWPLLLLVPLAWGALLLVDRRRFQRLRELLGRRLGALAEVGSAGRGPGPRRLAVTALLLAVLAAMQPFWGEDMRRLERRGLDILVCLDVSRSMLARDHPPSRLQSARREIRALAERLEGERMGLVAFAGESRLLIPLTGDMRSLVEMLETANPLSVRRGGTDLGAALQAALRALGDRRGVPGAIILVTDGEDLEGRGLVAARTCRTRGIRVHTVAFGSPLGSKIPLESEGGEAFLRDRSGAEVVSTVDEAGLRRIAVTTGGEFIAAADLPVPLIELYEKRILPTARRTIMAKERKERRNRFQWPLLAAFFLWILGLCSTGRKNH